jgi:hypothetical protein
MAETSDEQKKLKADRKAAKFEKHRQAWEKTRQRGREPFIIRRGVLGWGGFMIISTTCTDVFFRHKSVDELFWVSVLIGLAIWPLSGAIVGLIAWDSAERRFHDTTKQTDSINENLLGKA